MSTLSWNYRGLGNLEIVRELHKVVKQEGSALLFVMETKIRGRKVEELKTTLGFSGCFAVNSDGLSGGLGPFWSKEVNVTLQNYSTSHIDVGVRQGDKFWRFTGFYVEPRVENRHHSWRFMLMLFDVPHAAWICMGDFNEILQGGEQFGANPRPEAQMIDFRDVVADCALQELGWQGVPFTWDNKQHGTRNVKARLDRALVNQDFLQLFEFSKVQHISSVESDHYFVFVQLKDTLPSGWSRAERQFIYENVWESHPDYDDMVRRIWRTGSGQHGLRGLTDEAPLRELLKVVLGISVEAFSERYLGLPKAVCTGITSCMAKYWWAISIDKRSLHWLSWDKLATPKVKGGMGFKDLLLFNLAMLGKQGWRLLTHPTSLCSRVPKGKYFPNTYFLYATVLGRASATWKAIMAGREALKMGLVHRIGDGTSTSIWNDPWIPNTTTLKPTGTLGTTPYELVSEFIDQYTGSWDIEMVRQTFFHHEAEAILNITLSQTGGEDSLAWALEKHGIYTVKSAYRSLMTRNELRSLGEGTITKSSSANKQLWIALWKLRVVPKVRVSWWRVLRGILPHSKTLQH
ncbi:hypothetical protein D1007_14579 [Hordeum vulgare]|nr:hypothetical protein D1007_14579 [Hordeum vulgare]